MAYGNKSPIGEIEDEWIEVSDVGSSLGDGWVYVDSGVNGLPTVVELTEEVTHSVGINTTAYSCFCNVMPKDLIQLLPRMSGKPITDLLIVNICQSSECQTWKQDISCLLSQFHCDVKARDERSDGLAERVKELLVGAGVRNVRQKTLFKRGDQCGETQSKANYISDMALCHLSLQENRDATFYYKLGRALAALKLEGVVILCVYNNMALTYSQLSSPALQWAEAFDHWLTQRLLQKRFEDIVHFEKQFPHASNEEWLKERLCPLLVALGAAGEAATADRLNGGWAFASQT